MEDDVEETREESNTIHTCSNSNEIQSSYLGTVPQ